MTSQLQKATFGTSYNSIEIHYLAGTKVMYLFFFNRGGLGDWSKMSYVNPHQAAYHFEVYEKWWWLVKPRIFDLNLEINGACLMFYECYYVNV